MNCLLNAFSICVGEVSVFSLKVMVLVMMSGWVLLCTRFFSSSILFLMPFMLI